MLHKGLMMLLIPLISMIALAEPRPQVLVRDLSRLVNASAEDRERVREERDRTKADIEKNKIEGNVKSRWSFSPEEREKIFSKLPEKLRDENLYLMGESPHYKVFDRSHIIVAEQVPRDNAEYEFHSIPMEEILRKRELLTQDDSLMAASQRATDLATPDNNTEVARFSHEKLNPQSRLVFNRMFLEADQVPPRKGVWIFRIRRFHIEQDFKFIRDVVETSVYFVDENNIVRGELDPKERGAFNSIDNLRPKIFLDELFLDRVSKTEDGAIHFRRPPPPEIEKPYHNIAMGTQLLESVVKSPLLCIP